MATLFHLRDVIDVEILQEIQDEFAEATGLAAVTVDYKGKPITRYSNFSKFCKLIRQDPRCLEACHQSDAHGGLEAARKGKPYIYKCHTGLIDFAVPIIVEGQYLGSIMAGQAKIEDNQLISLDNIVKEVPGWKEKKEIIEAYNEIVPTSYNKLVAAAQMMFLVSNHIVEKGMVNLIQKELNNKNMKLIREMEARIKLEKALKDAELKVLQSQINPHFLFNVLNIIGRLSLIEKAYRTQEIVCLLSEMLRYTLKNINQIVSLEDEVLYIKRYLKIQSIRFGDRIRYQIDIPEDMKKVKVPFMILQPFIENAIKHGLEPKEEGGTVKIIGYSLEDDIVIKISDDGVGIPQDKLDVILDGEQSDNAINNSIGIGISNVNKRLIHYFGPEYKVKIKSELNVGTIVKILIPKRMNLR